MPVVLGTGNRAIRVPGIMTANSFTVTAPDGKTSRPAYWGIADLVVYFGNTLIQQRVPFARTSPSLPAAGAKVPFKVSDRGMTASTFTVTTPDGKTSRPAFPLGGAVPYPDTSSPYTPGRPQYFQVIVAQPPLVVINGASPYQVYVPQV